jgi:3-phosphoglycerate kinase
VVVVDVVEAVRDVVVVVRNIVEVVRDVVVGGVVEYQSCRPLNFLVTAKICKDLDEQTGITNFLATSNILPIVYL